MNITYSDRIVLSQNSVAGDGMPVLETGGLLFLTGTLRLGQGSFLFGYSAASKLVD